MPRAPLAALTAAAGAAPADRPHAFLSPVNAGARGGEASPLPTTPAAPAGQAGRKPSSIPGFPFFTGTRVFILAHQTCFLISGIIQTLGAQWLYYEGAASPVGMLTVFAQYLGMALAVFVPPWVGTPPESLSEYIQLANVLDGTVIFDVEGPPRRSVSSDSSEPAESRPRKSRRKSAERRSGGATVAGFVVRAWDAFARAALIREEEDSLELRDVLKLATMEVGACTMITVGLFYVGSGLYQVIYSSVVAFIALFSRYFLRKSLSGKQWAGIAIITAGLAMSALGARENDVSLAKDTIGHDVGSASRSTFGAFLVLFATVIYAGIYTFNDRILNKGPVPPSPERLCIAAGIFTAAISGTYVLLFTLPRFQTIIVSVLAPTSSAAEIVAMYATLVVASTAHNASLFVLIRHTGGVSTGVLQSLRAVAVFGLSHLWFCPSDAAQCLTFSKVLSAVLVACGVLLYSFASAAAAANRRTNSSTSLG